jgi:hypothetical protein
VPKKENVLVYKFDIPDVLCVCVCVCVCVTVRKNKPYIRANETKMMNLLFSLLILWSRNFLLNFSTPIFKM